MWCRLKSRASDDGIDALLRRADAIVHSADGKETVNWAKEFFEGGPPNDGNLDLLRQFHRDLWPEIAGQVAFDVPVVDHAILLIKAAGAAGTALHQDRPYWVRKEASPSIVSVWIALGAMSRERGGLMLSPENQVDLGEMASFNTGSVLEHEQGTVPAGGFPITIPNRIASRMAESMRCIDMAKGEAIAFDSFEPHMSGPNTTAAPRLAMKIAYGEGREKTKYLARVEALDCGS